MMNKTMKPDPPFGAQITVEIFKTKEGDWQVLIGRVASLDKTVNALAKAVQRKISQELLDQGLEAREFSLT